MISIIIPIYNSEKYIGECIQSVLNQTYDKFELILVDDGSTDASYKICQEYSRKDCRIKLIQKKNGGVSSARYEGLKIAQGEYIAFLDNDDIWLPDFLQYTIKIMDSDTDIVVISSANILSENISQYISASLREKKTNTIIDEYTGVQAVEEMAGFSRYEISKPLWGKLYRRDFLISLHLETYMDRIPILFLEDVFALNIILINARKVKFSNKILYIQRAIIDSQSRSGKLSEFYFNQIDSYALLYEYMQEKSVPKALTVCLDNYDKCLERIWYKIRHEGIQNNNILQICNRVNKRYDEYYEKFLQLNIGRIRKINMVMFKKYRKIWEYTLGCFYFKIVSVYKRKLLIVSLNRNDG